MSKAAGGAASMAFKAANKRFKATKESRDYIFEPNQYQNVQFFLNKNIFCFF